MFTRFGLWSLHSRSQNRRSANSRLRIRRIRFIAPGSRQQAPSDLQKLHHYASGVLARLIGGIDTVRFALADLGSSIRHGKGDGQQLRDIYRFTKGTESFYYRPLGTEPMRILDSSQHNSPCVYFRLAYCGMLTGVAVFRSANNPKYASRMQE